MIARVILSIFCLFAATNPVMAEEPTTDVTAGPQCNQRASLRVTADSAKMERIYKMAPLKELSILAQRIYKINKFRSEKEKTPPPQELTDDILSDRSKLIEYIKANAR